MPACPWCTETVASEGETCSPDCYALWWAWYMIRGDLAVVTPSGRVVILSDGETPPFDMERQVWYRAFIDSETPRKEWS